MITSSDEPLTTSKDDRSSWHGKGPKQVKNFLTTATVECPLCKGQHPLYQCQGFAKLRQKERHVVATRASLCLNCLRPGHGYKQCKSTFTCKTCYKKHHTLLYFSESSSSSCAPSEIALPTNSQAWPSMPRVASESLETISLITNIPSRDLLVTAKIHVYNLIGQVRTCRVLLDTCSNTKFITERLTTLLSLSKTKFSISIAAMNKTRTVTNNLVSARVRSRIYNFERTLNFLTVDDIAGHVPDERILRNSISLPRNIRAVIIQEKTKSCNWRYVRSHDNPADLISRGQLPSAYVSDLQWKNGPVWLIQDESIWPQLGVPTIEQLPGLRKVKCLATPIQSDILTRYLSIVKLRRFIAYAQRFKLPRKHQTHLTCDELESANMTIVKLIQAVIFFNELRDLREEGRVYPKNKLISLSPFLDDLGIMRIGGRLANSKLSFAAKHPIILPQSHFCDHTSAFDYSVRTHRQLSHRSANYTLFFDKTVLHHRWTQSSTQNNKRLHSMCKSKPSVNKLYYGQSA